MKRAKAGHYINQYSKKDIIKYLKGIANLLKRSPVYRDLKKIPGPSPRTIIRRFGSWSKALKKAGLRPHTNQLMKGEKTYIRKNWRKVTDKEIAKTFGVSEQVIKYYRMNFNLWKNRKGISKIKIKKDAMKIYGNSCEICNIPIVQIHHIISKSTNYNEICILCPLCHSAITTKKVIIKNRYELRTKLKSYMKNIYSNLKI